MAGILTEEQFQLLMQHVMPTVQNQILQQAAATTPSGRKRTLHPKCFSRLDKFAGGEEKWREWSYDFRMATATQNATVFEILNWIEKNREHTFGLGRAGRGGYRTGGVSDVLDGGSGGRSYTPSRGFLVQAKEGGMSL